MGLVAIEGDEVPRAPHEGTFVNAEGHRAWFPAGAPLLGGYVAEDVHVPLADAELAPERRTRETGTQRRKRETAD